MPWNTLNTTVRPLDNPHDRPVKRYGHSGITRDRKARIADMLNELEPHVAPAGYDLLRRLFNEVER